MYRSLPLLLSLSLFTASAFAQQQVLKGATLYDGNGGEPIENSVVVVDSHVHYAASGWFDTRQVFPFLHQLYDLEQAQAYLRENPAELDRSYMCSGVTAVFDTGSFPWTVSLQETSVASTEKPRFVAAGQLITHDSARGGAMVLAHQKFDGTHEFLPMNSDEEALSSVAAIAASGGSACRC